jgi:hypothetical protein
LNDIVSMKNINKILKFTIINHFDTKTPMTYSECQEIENKTGHRTLLERHFNTQDPLTFSECDFLIKLLGEIK